MKHTPEPWYAWNIQLGPEGKGPYSFPLGTDSETAAANARLIAAAPEMYEALRRAVNHLIMSGTKCTDAPEALEQARAAIRKAEGGE